MKKIGLLTLILSASIILFGCSTVANPLVCHLAYDKGNGGILTITNLSGLDWYGFKISVTDPSTKDVYTKNLNDHLITPDHSFIIISYGDLVDNKGNIMNIQNVFQQNAIPISIQAKRSDIGDYETIKSDIDVSLGR